MERPSRQDAAITPLRLSQEQTHPSPFAQFAASLETLSPLPSSQAAEAPRFFKTPAAPAFGGGVGTAHDGSLHAPPPPPPPLSVPLHSWGTSAGPASTGRRVTHRPEIEQRLDVAARVLHVTGFSFADMALSLDSPRHVAAAAGPADEQTNCEAPAVHAAAARQAAAAAGTAAKSRRRSVDDSPQDGAVAAGDPRRRCLTFETPRPARVRKSRGRAFEDPSPASAAAGALLSPPGQRAPAPPRRRRASDAPASLAGAPETPDLGLFGELAWSAPGSGQGRQGAKPASGCNNCNCKKSRCLKLYCECFAAGLFCDNGSGVTCACQNCLNTSAHAALVAETRATVEARNPLAFLPKIVSQTLDTRAGLLDASTPRHKKGCHCKKSACLKKYCECFQAGVQCTAACRCDGCRNCAALGGPGPGPSQGLLSQGPFSLPAPRSSGRKAVAPITPFDAPMPWAVAL